MTRTVRTWRWRRSVSESPTAPLSTWLLYNVEQAQPFDPFPFILLNLLLSCLAAVQAPIILMSQNRPAEKDRREAAAADVGTA